MSGKVVGWAFDVGRELELAATERYVLVALADNADHNGKCWPSPKELIEKTGLGTSSVYRALTCFREKGLMEDGEDDKGRPFRQLNVPTVGNPIPTGGKKSPQGESDSHGGKRSISEEPSQTVTNQVREIFDFWKTAVGKNGSTRLTRERTDKVKARLRSGYDVEYIKRAVANCAGSAWHMKRGEHSGRDGKAHNDLVLICRSDTKLEEFHDIADPGDGGDAWEGKGFLV
jgi:Helix-turn-helix domain